ncbi:hypothetical protein ACQ4LE_001104 [Meloidogyne hapla]|uniref:Uncharacterized protein n=1 Tax=Meloidogyne hapla TaxID=6305 RepID=A0A1I8BH20_MELHA
MYYFNINIQNLYILLIIIFFLINDWSNDLSVNAKFQRHGNSRPPFPAHPPRIFPNVKSRPNPSISRGRPITNAAIHQNFGVRGRNLPLTSSRKSFAQLRAPAAPSFKHRPLASIADIPLNLIFTPGAPGTG